jgi:signal transduction histidine kinase
LNDVAHTPGEAREPVHGQTAQLEAAQARIAELTTELDETNRGIIALHTELEAARESEARARAEREVSAERDRIARDLHDLVIQRVFAAGLALQGVLGVIDHPRALTRVRGVIDDLDATIRQLRTAIFALGDQPQKAASLRAELIGLTARAHDGLGFAPAIAFQGPVDAAVPDHIAGDLLAVAREALSNIARHAHATRVEITVHAADDLLLRVVDNGRGLGGTTRSSGLTNMRSRAEAYGGAFTISSAPGTGTLLEWRVPLPGVPGVPGVPGQGNALAPLRARVVPETAETAETVDH